jgi:prophage regulatory protein
MSTRQDLQDDSDQRTRQARSERGLRRIIRLPKVEELTGRKRSAIYEGIAAGSFPAPVPLGPRAVGWLEDEIFDWQQRCIALRDERRAEERVPLAGSEQRQSREARPTTEVIPDPARPRSGPVFERTPRRTQSEAGAHQRAEKTPAR